MEPKTYWIIALIFITLGVISKIFLFLLGLMIGSTINSVEIPPLLTITAILWILISIATLNFSAMKNKIGLE